MSAHPLRRVAEGAARLAPAVVLVACAAHTPSTVVTMPPGSASVTSTTGPPSTLVATVVESTMAPIAVAQTIPSTTPAPAPPVASTTVDQAAANTSTIDWVAMAGALGPLALPSDCPLPLGSPGLLPNADRSYRGGVHQGIDFVCLEWGRTATTPLPGVVVSALHGYQEPTIEQRNALLDEAKALGFTPPSTLQFLFGRFVVIDHGAIPGVGHVISIYAHLAEIDPSIQPGAAVAAGSTVGWIGNSGTETAVTQGTRPQSIHLHWELHIDGVPFASGLDERATNSVSAELFGRDAE